jgi:acyl-coenzyme A synthetase/AMP-(fatty) acid ligase
MEAKGIHVVTPHGLETAVLGYPPVAEPGLIGRADELRGEVTSVFVVLSKASFHWTKSYKGERQ